MRFYFDTSAINAIVDHPSSLQIARRISSQFETVFSSLNVFEMLRTRDRDRRLKLFIVASTLANGGGNIARTLADKPIILRRALYHFLEPNGALDFLDCQDFYEWQRDLLRNPAGVLDDDLAIVAREGLSHIEPRHASHMAGDRERALEEFSRLDRTDQNILRSGRAGVLRYMARNSELLTSVVGDHLKDPSLSVKIQQIRGRELDLLQNYDCWRFNLAQFAINLYNRTIQTNGYGRNNNAGWTDIEQGVYLAATDVFITHDRRQLDFLRLVAVFGERRVRVMSFQTLLLDLGISR